MINIIKYNKYNKIEIRAILNVSIFLMKTGLLALCEAFKIIKAANFSKTGLEHLLNSLSYLTTVTGRDSVFTLLYCGCVFWLQGRQKLLQPLIGLLNVFMLKYICLSGRIFMCVCDCVRMHSFKCECMHVCRGPKVLGQGRAWWIVEASW